ncbi:MAG: redoxin domain-containing protein, partial [Phycisphaerales bacterium]
TDEAGLARVKYAQVETNIVAGADGLASTFIRGASLLEDEPYEIILSPGYTITGKVVGPEGNPIGGAMLSSQKKDFTVGYMNEFILKATTDERGTFILKGATEGAYEIQVQIQKPHEALYANPVSVEVKGNAPVAGVKILAQKGAVLKGKYVTKHKLRTADRTIFIHMSSPIRHSWRTQTAGDGSFAVSGLPPKARGSIDFIGVSGYHSALTMTTAHPSFHISGRRINFNDVPPGVYEGVEVHYLLAGRITGKVLDPSGNPMPHQEIVVRPRGYIYRTNDKGEYTAEIPPVEDITIEVRDPSSRQTIIHSEPFRIEEGQVIEKNLKVGERPSKLVGQSLPDFEGIDIEFRAEHAKDQRILVCFWDMQQRPSRNCAAKLAARAAELKRDGVTVLGIQVSPVERDQLDAWVKRSSIPFPIGTVRGDAEKIRSAWGAKSLPWLILTDTKHIVVSEGFSLGEIDKQLKNSNPKMR